MKIDIITQGYVKRVVQMELLKEMNNVYKILDKFKERLIEVERKVKHNKIKGINKNE